MAASFCKVELMGTLLSAPTMRNTPNGENVCVLPLEVVQPVVTPFGRTVEERLTVEIEAGERLASILQSGLSAGQVLMVEGRLRQYPLQPRGRKTVVAAESIQILGSEDAPTQDYPEGEALDNDMLENMQPAEGEALPY
ncbi:MAG: single-stranded DNA-binding protein [Victivallales bacterium]|nr:single-stranded DNA-binding protein [Victivallales bacterium]